MTKITQQDIDSINEIIKPLVGHYARNVKLGIGSFITMEFGNQVITTRGKQYGEWYLWLYECVWYLENPAGEYVGSDDPREALGRDIEVLEGQRLDNIKISDRAFETEFYFSNGCILHTFPVNFVDPVEYWKLFTPGDKILVLGPGLSWSYKPSNLP